MIAAELILGHDENALEQVRKIRHTVFCEEQAIAKSIEQDGLDASSIHALVTVSGVAAATGRLLITLDDYIIGRVAVMPQFRNKGLGDLVMRLLIRTAFDMGAEHQTVHSQLSAQGFYEKLNFIPQGKPYEEAGIPHITMVRKGDIFGKCQFP
ncbi:MAG: GNAT family N-acetyltransferase [Turicibacter sp.]|nr:GNAT family N-acetyltransferase [Turicibacter sp.]